MARAKRVAAQLGIPFYAVDAQQTHYEAVVNTFVEGYRSGITPNPCIACNRHVRWGFLMDRAKAFGASYLSTGHYASIKKDENGEYHLHKSSDAAKDQTYVLH